MGTTVSPEPIQEPVSVDDNASTLSVDDGAGSLTIDGTVTVQDGGNVISVDDAAGSLTVDNAALSVTGGGVEAAAQRVTIASDSTGVLSVDDNGGNLSIDDGGNSITVDNGGTFAVQDSEKVADNAAFTDGTTKVQPSGFIFDEVAGTALTENDAAAARIDSKRAQVSVIEDETTRGRRAAVTAANALKVDASGVAVPVTDNAGSLTVDGTVTANQGTAGTAWEVIGDVAHDVAAPANPVVVGGQMETMADSAPGTRAGTDGDAAKLATTDGAQYVITTGPQTWSYHENSSSALTDATVHAAPGAGLSLYVTDIVCSTGAATALNIFFEESTTTVLGPYYLEAVAGRGLAIHFGTPKKVTANTALTVTTSAAIAHGIDVTGFIAPG